MRSKRRRRRTTASRRERSLPTLAPRHLPCPRWPCIPCGSQEAHETGVALARACPQDEAEAACEALRINGLCSTIEPGC